MWISRADYTRFIATAAKHEAENVFLLARVNELLAELGQLRFEKTGKPQNVPNYARGDHRPPDDHEISFDDVGDDEAKRLGLVTEDTSRVVLPA